MILEDIYFSINLCFKLVGAQLEHLLLGCFPQVPLNLFFFFMKT